MIILFNKNIVIMTLVRYQNQVPNVIERFFNNDLMNWNRNDYLNTDITLPSVNIKETNNEFAIEVAVPGFEKSDFNIEIDDNLLTISSEKQIENEEKDGEKITRREFSYQSFKRTFSLPEMVEEDKITAKYENGILLINIPKKEEVKPKPAKKIQIK